MDAVVWLVLSQACFELLVARPARLWLFESTLIPSQHTEATVVTAFMLPRLFILCIAHTAALDKEYSGYYHFKGVSMDLGPPKGYTDNVYVTPGDGAHPLGYQKTRADLELAKHLCDVYPECQWFDSGGGYPGSIGWYNVNVTVDTYIKNITGPIVKGSTYYDNMYMFISGVDIFCNKIAGPWQLPPDQVKAQCDQLTTCDGFTVKNDLSSGFLCQFNSHCATCESFVKLPIIGRATKPLAAQ